jgi:hypothetical protein
VCFFPLFSTRFESIFTSSPLVSSVFFQAAAPVAAAAAAPAAAAKAPEPEEEEEEGGMDFDLFD